MAETNAIQNVIYVSVICENPNVIVESAYLFKLTVITKNVILEIVIGVILLYISLHLSLAEHSPPTTI